jgi:hypothetical protein
MESVLDDGLTTDDRKQQDSYRYRPEFKYSMYDNSTSRHVHSVLIKISPEISNIHLKKNSYGTLAKGSLNE